MRLPPHLRHRLIMSNCTAGLITMAFMTQNPAIIAAVVVVYFVVYFLFRKNKVRFQDYLEFLATGKRPGHKVDAAAA